MTIFTVLLWLALACLVYAAVVRPILHAIPVLKDYYREAATPWSRFSALAWHSATVAWGYLVALVAATVSLLDNFAAAVGDPELKQEITDAFASYGPRIIAGIAIISIVARLRSVKKS